MNHKVITIQRSQFLQLCVSLCIEKLKALGFEVNVTSG